MRNYEVGIFFTVGQNLARIKNRNEYVPLGLLYIISSIEKLHLFNLNIIEITSKSNLSTYNNFDFQCLSITSSSTYNFLKEKVKGLPPANISRIIGGFHATLFPENTLVDFNCQIIVLGDGEKTIQNLLIALINSRRWDHIDGILFQKKNRNFINQNITQFEENYLKEIEIPARKSIDQGLIVSKNRFTFYHNVLTVSMITSRGCPFSCHFCASQIKIVRLTPKVKIQEEIDYIKNHFPNVGGIVFSDETATLNLSHLKSLCDVMKTSGLIWSIQTRLDMINDEKLVLMKHSNCVELKFGLESASQKILDNMNKGMSLNKIEKNLKTSHNYGFAIKLLLIFGLPGENEESLRETTEFINRNKQYIDRITIFNFCPLPGSYIYNNPSKFKLDEEKMIRWDQIGIHKNFQWWWGTKDQFIYLKDHEVQFKSTIQSLIGRKHIETSKNIYKRQ